MSTFLRKLRQLFCRRHLRPSDFTDAELEFLGRYFFGNRKPRTGTEAE